MPKCDDCKLDMPETSTLISMSKDGIAKRMKRCPICALAYTNRVAGLSPTTAFAGPRAHLMFVRAVRHLGDQAPEWAKIIAAKGQESQA